MTPRAKRLAVVGALVAILPTIVVAGVSAVQTMGWPFPSLFVDPFAVFSGVHLPTWGNEAAGVSYPDRLLELNGRAITPRPSAARQASAILRDARLSTVQARFAHAGMVQLNVRRLNLDELWLLFGVYALVGIVVLWSGVVVLNASQRTGAAAAYFCWAATTCLFLLTFYDYHTQAWLYPLFSISSLGVALAPLWLAYAFPSPPRVARRACLGGVVSVTCLGAFACLWICVSIVTGVDYAPVRRAVSGFIDISLLVSGISFAGRWWRGSTAERAELRTVVWGMGLLPILAAIANLASKATGLDFLHTALPLLVIIPPLSIGYALIERNLLRVRAVLSQRMFFIPIFVTALVGSSLVWTIMAALIRQHRLEQVAPLMFGILAFLFLVALSWRASRRLLYTVERKFRPTIVRLSDQLASLTEDASVRRAIEEVVAFWLPSSSVSVIGDDAGLRELLGAHPNACLLSGQRTWTSDDLSTRRLLLPMRSAGKLRGVLAVAPKRDGALLTEDDLAMLETIAGLGAIALHNAQTIAELDDLRRADSFAAREDKRLTLASLSAEIAHEIAYPLNFFRHILNGLAQNEGHTSDEVDIGREEVERLSRMVGSLRRMSLPQPAAQSVRLMLPLRRAVDLIRDLIAERHLSVDLAVPEDVVVQVDRDFAVQIFANLIRNAAQAAPAAGRLGVRYREETTGSLVEVWDNGSGVPSGLEQTIFNPWITTREGGSGLGLAVAQRLARQFGWTISYARENGESVFRLRIRDVERAAT